MSEESTHPYVTSGFIFFNELISPSTRIATVFYQYMFYASVLSMKQKYTSFAFPDSVEL